MEHDIVLTIIQFIFKIIKNQLFVILYEKFN